MCVRLFLVFENAFKVCKFNSIFTSIAKSSTCAFSEKLSHSSEICRQIKPNLSSTSPKYLLRFYWICHQKYLQPPFQMTWNWIRIILELYLVIKFQAFMLHYCGTVMHSQQNVDFFQKRFFDLCSRGFIRSKVTKNWFMKK